MPDLPLAPAPSVTAAVRLIASRLGAASVHLYAADAAGALGLVAAGGPHGHGPHGDSLAAIAETLGSKMSVLDVSGVVAGVRFAVGARSGRAALVALGVDLGRLDGAWDVGFADAVALAAGVVAALDVAALDVAALDVAALDGAPPATPASSRFEGSFPSDASGHARLLHEVATHAGAFDERLQIALEGLADALALDGAALGLVDGAVWSPEAAFDPHGVFPAGPVAVRTLPCSVTVCADGPVAMENAGGGFGAYLGVPVFAGGRTIGTLVAAGRAARTAPFTADERALAESLARWVGGAIGGRASARRLTDREAALSAFVDRAPVAMGLVTLDVGAPDDVRFVTVNAAAARLLGDEPTAIAGRLASAVGVGARTRRAWAVGCRSALAAASGEALAPVTLTIETPGGPRVVDATLSRLDVHDAVGARVTCVSFVAEDVTEREHALRATAERRDAAETAAADQEALFARLHHDLRTPLTTILGYADLLGLESPPDEIETVREVVLRSGRHLLAMLDDAVVLSEASRASVSLVPTAAGALVRSAVDVCAAIAEEAGVDLLFESTVSEAPVLLDTSLVRRVVQTLVTEAVGVSGARHVDARLSEEGTWLVFDVGVRERTGQSPETVRPPAALVERLVYRLGGTLDTHVSDGGRRAGAARWTVRLPRHPAVVVEMPDAAGAPDSAWVSDGLLRP